MHGRDGLSQPFPRLVRAPMKWAGLETPKCVTVHQRVNEPLYATLLSRSDISLRLTDSYTANNKLLIHGQPFSKGQLNLVTIYFRNLSFTVSQWI